MAWGGQLEARAVSAVPALSSAWALKDSLNSSFMLANTLQEDVEEGACPAFQQWKESVACGMCGSSVPVPYNRCCHMQTRQSFTQLE